MLLKLLLRHFEIVGPKNKVGLSPTGTFAIELGNYKPTHGTCKPRAETSYNQFL